MRLTRFQRYLLGGLLVWLLVCASLGGDEVAAFAGHPGADGSDGTVGDLGGFLVGEPERLGEDERGGHEAL